MTNRESKLVVLAHKMMLTPAQAVALPTTVDLAAGKVGMTPDRFIDRCFAIPALSEYIASVCRQVVA